MRMTLLASVVAPAALLCLGGVAAAQNSTGSPASNSASNITSSNTRSAIAPRLPVPAGDSSPDQYLQAAQSALSHGHTGAAQEALERAESRLLDRSTDPAAAGQPDNSPRVQAIRQALQALGSGDRKGASQAIQTAMNAPSGGMDSGSMAGTGASTMHAMPNTTTGATTSGSATPMTGSSGASTTSGGISAGVAAQPTGTPASGDSSGVGQTGSTPAQ